MKYVLIAAVLIAAVFIAALQFIPIGIEPLTEVYFENHTSLPGKVFLNKSYSFDFTVHNLEYRMMNYTYNVNVEYANRTGALDKGSFYLADNSSTTFSKNFKFMEHFDRAKISIVVSKDNNETIDIHFWVDEIVPMRIIIEKENETTN